MPKSVESDRLDILQRLLKRQQRDFDEACVGKTLSVLLEKRGRHDGQLVGRSPYLQSVHVAATDRAGDIVPVFILGANTNSLSGSLASGCRV